MPVEVVLVADGVIVANAARRVAQQCVWKLVQGADLRLVPKAANLEERGRERDVSSSFLPLSAGNLRKQNCPRYFNVRQGSEGHETVTLFGSLRAPKESPKRFNDYCTALLGSTKN